MPKHICEECGKEFHSYKSRSRYCSNACRARMSHRVLIKDLTGQKFGRWTVIGYAKTVHETTCWLCECECGNRRIVHGVSLKSGRSKSCGCLKLEIISSQAKRLFSKPIRPGTIFGRLTVIRENGRKCGCIAYLCKCSCGKEKTIASGHLRNGSIVSCGCYSVEQLRKRNITHGLSGSPCFSRWRHQIKRDIDCGWTPAMNKAILSLQTICIICGSTEKLSIDHVNPMSKGFGLEPGNAVVLCKSCNSRKHDKLLANLPKEWQKKLKKAAKEFADYWKNTRSY